MKRASLERSVAFSGIAVFITGAVGGALERGWPSATEPAAVAAFIQANRAAILGQSMAFVLSATLYLWFFSALRELLARAEGATGTLSAIVFAGGVVWAGLQVVAQAMQVGIAMAPAGSAQPAFLWTMAAMFSLANLPLGIALLATAIVTFRTAVFPRWLGGVALLTSCAQATLWAGAVARSGPLAVNGWLTYVLYPLQALWLLATIVVTLRRARDERQAAA